MKRHIAYGFGLLASIVLQNAAALQGERSQVDATLRIKADRLVSDEDLIAALSQILDAEEDVEVLSVRETVSRGQQSASKKKGSGRTLLAAPTSAPAEADSSRDLMADQQGTGQRPVVSSERLFTTAAVPRGDSILNHLGFGLQQQPLQTQSQDQGMADSAGSLQVAASSPQQNLVGLQPSSMWLWDTSVADAQLRGVPAASLYADSASLQGPGQHGAPAVPTGFGLQKKPARSSGSDAQQPLTDETLVFPAAVPAAAVPVRSLWQEGPAGGSAPANARQSLISQIGIGLERPPGGGGGGALSDDALDFGPAAAAMAPAAAVIGGSGRGSGGIGSLQSVQYRQRAEGAVSAASVAPGAVAVEDAIGGPVAAGAPLSARRRGLAAWSETLAEVQDDGWARNGWHSAIKIGAANSASAKAGASWQSAAKAGAKPRASKYRLKLMSGTDAGNRRVAAGAAGNDGLHGGRRQVPAGASNAYSAELELGNEPGARSRTKSRRMSEPKDKSYIVDALDTGVVADFEDERKQQQQHLTDEDATGSGSTRRGHTAKNHKQGLGKEIEMDNISEEDLPRMTRAGRTAVRKMPARTKEESVQQLASIRISTPNPKFVSQLGSPEGLERLGEALLDLGIELMDIAIVPVSKGKGAMKGSTKGESMQQKHRAKSGRVLSSSGATLVSAKELPPRLAASIKAAAGFVSLKPAAGAQAQGAVTTN